MFADFSFNVTFDTQFDHGFFHYVVRAQMYASKDNYMLATMK